jgi:putative transposase
MRTPHYRRLAVHVQEQTANVVLRQCRPADYSKRCTAWTLLSSLILAAANGLSLAAVAALRPRSPSRETLRQALFATLPQYAELRQQLAALVRASLPRSLRRHPRRRYPLAIDVHQVAYFKRQRTPPVHVRKGKRHPGTSYGHLYASASLLRKGQYYVVALTPYDPQEDTASLVRRLLRQAAANGFAPRYVLMDRGFWSTDVFRYLQRAHCPFLIPVMPRGKKPTTPGGPTGTWVFLHGCRTGCYRYQVRSHRHGQRGATVTIVVHRRNWAGHRGRHGRYTWAYAMWRMNLSTIAWVRHSYRRRFRIESSYRLLEEARGRTSSRNEGWRLWFVILAVIMLNCWLHLRRIVSQGRDQPPPEKHWWNRLLLALTYCLLWESANAASSQAPPVAQLSPHATKTRSLAHICNY